MLSLLERTISGVDRRLLLLAPPDTSLPPTLRAIDDLLDTANSCASCSGFAAASTSPMERSSQSNY